MTAKCLICGEELVTQISPKRRRDREKSHNSDRGQMLRLMAEHLDEVHPEEAEECELDAGNITSVLVSDNFECKSESFRGMKLETLNMYIEQLGEIRSDMLGLDLDPDPRVVKEKGRMLEVMPVEE